jgi:hypothetical protein
MPGGRPKGSVTKATQEKLDNSATVADDLIEDVFNHWIDAMGKNPKRVALDEKRRRNIGNAISFYGVETCKDAIDGCLLSDFHMGRNRQNKKYNDIELILRDAEHIERFLSYLGDE